MSAFLSLSIYQRYTMVHSCLNCSFVAVVTLTTLLVAAPFSVAQASQRSQSEQEQFDTRPAERPASSLLRRPIFDVGRWSLGIDGLYSMTTSRAELLDSNGGVASDSTSFLRIDPQVSVVIMPNFEVGLITGLISRRLSQGDGDSVTDTGFAIQPLARYHVPTTQRLAFYGQVAPGYYTGRTSREVGLDDDDGTRINGVVLSAGLGINYRLSEGVQLRFGLTYTGLWGRERVEIDDIVERLTVSTTNIGSTAGLRYTF